MPTPTTPRRSLGFQLWQGYDLLSWITAQNRNGGGRLLGLRLTLTDGDDTYLTTGAEDGKHFPYRVTIIAEEPLGSGVMQQKLTFVGVHPDPELLDKIDTHIHAGVLAGVHFGSEHTGTVFTAASTERIAPNSAELKYALEIEIDDVPF